jgi:hypothetical protein
MLGVAALLTMIGKTGAEPLVNFYDSYLSWTAGMLPLFYVPTLAVLPSLLQGECCCAVAAISGTSTALLRSSCVFALFQTYRQPLRKVCRSVQLSAASDCSIAHSDNLLFKGVLSYQPSMQAQTYQASLEPRLQEQQQACCLQQQWHQSLRQSPRPQTACWQPARQPQRAAASRTLCWLLLPLQQ